MSSARRTLLRDSYPILIFCERIQKKPAQEPVGDRFSLRLRVHIRAPCYLGVSFSFFDRVGSFFTIDRFAASARDKHGLGQGR